MSEINDWIDVVLGINKRFIEITKDIAKKYNLEFKSFNPEIYGEEEVFQRVKALYKDEYIRKIRETWVDIIYTKKEDEIIIKIDRNYFTRRKIYKLSEKTLQKMEEKFIKIVEEKIANFARDCKEESIIRTKIYNLLDSKVGLKPNELDRIGEEFIACFNRENEKDERVELIVKGKANTDSIKITKIEIYDKKGQRLPYFLEQIFQIFNN